MKEQGTSAMVTGRGAGAGSRSAMTQLNGFRPWYINYLLSHLLLQVRRLRSGVGGWSALLRAAGEYRFWKCPPRRRAGWPDPSSTGDFRVSLMKAPGN